MRIAAFGLLLGSLCLAACGDNDNNIVVHLPQPTPFLLRTINAFGLPFAIVDQINPQFSVEVLSGSFLINTNGTFIEVFRLRETQIFVITFRTVACSGTFTNVGSTFTFVTVGSSADCGGIFTGVASIDALNTTFRGFPVFFTR